MSKHEAKRVDIVTLKMVKEASFLYGQRQINSPSDADSLMREFMADADREQFCVACLNTKNEPTCISTVSIGTLNSSLVHPREIFKVALMANANSILLFHNHPSGNPTPSKEDLEVTKRLYEAGQVMGIEVMDHIIIGSYNHYVSLKERGLLD